MVGHLFLYCYKQAQWLDVKIPDLLTLIPPPSTLHQLQAGVFQFHDILLYVHVVMV